MDNELTIVFSSDLEEHSHHKKLKKKSDLLSSNGSVRRYSARIRRCGGQFFFVLPPLGNRLRNYLLLLLYFKCFVQFDNSFIDSDCNENKWISVGFLKAETRPPGGADWKWNLATMNPPSVSFTRRHRIFMLEIVLRNYLNAAIYIANVSC